MTAETSREPVLVQSLTNRVMTLRFNDPRKKNAWGAEMLEALLSSLNRAASDPSVSVVILTGTGDYYCSGVDFVSSFPVMRPSLLVEHLHASNQRLFDTFILFPKPIIVAANGPAIGASVTSATLCDAILASPTASFHTPFAALGIVPEGCSSYWFEKVMGVDASNRMLGAEGWRPTAAEAHAAGFVRQVIGSGDVLAAAQVMGENWASSGRRRSVVEQGEVPTLLKVNAAESKALARAFVDTKFLSAMYEAARAKGKTKLAAAFWVLMHTRPLWSRL